MTHTHTPAPWSDSGHDGKENLIVESGYGSICAVWRVNGYGCQVADARLIAAAPEMLEALRACVKDMEGLLGLSDFGNPTEEDFPLAIARAAIAKAEGGDA
jgi:hypothetical protein